MSDERLQKLRHVCKELLAIFLCNAVVSFKNSKHFLYFDFFFPFTAYNQVSQGF